MQVILGTIEVKDIIALSMIACSRPSDSREQCSDGGERVKLYAENTRGKKRGETRPFDFVNFFLINFSTALYYLNTWNRLSL